MGLDLDNAKVQDELTKIVEFWATNGVDGFVVKEADGIPSSLLEKFRRALETVEAESDVKYLPEVIRVLDGGAVSAVAPYVAPSEGEVALKRFPSNAVPLEPGQAKIFNFVPKF